MNVEFDKLFLKSLENLQDSKILRKIEAIILHSEAAKTLFEIRNLKNFRVFQIISELKSAIIELVLNLLIRKQFDLSLFLTERYL